MMFGFSKNKKTKISWHPDFRIVESLPDIKIVRTKFIINLIGIVVFCLLLVFVGYREIIKIGLRQSVKVYQAEIQNRQPSNRKLTTMSGEFRKLGDELKDIKQFKEKPLNLIEIVVELSKVCNSEIIFDRISYKDFWDSNLKQELHKIQLNGKGRRTADIGELKTRLSALKVAENYKIQISEMGNPTKDNNTGIFSFIIVVTISEANDGTK
jgi:alpha-N-acetylglucosamine transferase